MWYFAWVLGLAFACAAGILNAMWYEFERDDDALRKPSDRRE